MRLLPSPACESRWWIWCWAKRASRTCCRTRVHDWGPPVTACAKALADLVLALMRTRETLSD